MDLLTILAFCPTSEFVQIEGVIREWPGVEAVGSLRTKERKKDITNVFIKFNSVEAARAGSSKIPSVPGLSLTDEENEGRKQGDKKNTKKAKAKNLEVEFLSFGAYEKQRNTTEQQRRRGPEKHQRGRENRGGKVQNGNRQHQHQQQQRHHVQNREFKRRQYPFIPPAKVSVAFADNIPFNMTNGQLLDVFSPYGRVIDINRYELMVMVFYDSPEAVLHCIQQLNGKTVKGNVISVSSGSVRIPGPAALQMGI